MLKPQAWLRRIRPAGKTLWQWRYRTLLVLSTLAALWHFGLPLLLGPVIYADRVVRAEFVQSVVASGHVEAPFRVNVSSQITGVVVDVPVSEGQAVKSGDALVVLDDREARAAVIQAQSSVAQAEARLRQLRELTLPLAEETLRQATATLTNAQQTYIRAAKLAADGYGTQAALDEAQKSLDVARAQVRYAELQVFTNRPSGSDYVMTETQLSQALAVLATAQAKLNYTIITTPRDGILISRDVERGAVVQPSNVLMKLSPSGDTEIVVQIDEKNLGLIVVGQSALGSADAFAKDTFAAEVVYINPGIDLQRGSVEVKLRIPTPPSYLRQDMTVSVDIETARRPNALVIPASDLRGVSTGKPWVIKIVGAHATRQPVQVGLVSGGKAEILKGLSENELVLPATLAVKEGGRVRVRTAHERTL